jgi:hypothetical protein
MTRRSVQACAGVLILATAVWGVYRIASGGASPSAHTGAAAHAAASSSTSRTANASTVALNPLTIAAMRARAYPASTLTLVRSDGDQGGYVNSVVSFVSDGLTEYSLMSVPDSARPAAGWPVVIISHGYLDPRTYRTDDGSYAQFIATLARAGYLVLKPDYRGHGQSQGAAEGGYLPLGVIAAAAQLPKSTAHGLLQTLVSEDLVEHDSDRGRYRLSTNLTLTDRRRGSL